MCVARTTALLRATANADRFVRRLALILNIFFPGLDVETLVWLHHFSTIWASLHQQTETETENKDHPDQCAPGRVHTFVLLSRSRLVPVVKRFNHTNHSGSGVGNYSPIRRCRKLRQSAERGRLLILIQAIVGEIIWRDQTLIFNLTNQ